MISQEHIVITPHDGSLSCVDQVQLAPYTADELGQYVPFPDEYNRHNPVWPDEYRLTAEELVQLTDKKEHSLTWGIYVNSEAVGGNTSANFVGTMAISETIVGTAQEPRRTKLIQELHTSIFSSEWQRKGIGTLSQLAVASYAFDRQKAIALSASASENNIGPHRALTKTGFSRLDTYEHYNFPDGAMTTYWMLLSPEAQERNNKSEERELLAVGWSRYEAAKDRVTITYEETK